MQLVDDLKEDLSNYDFAIVITTDEEIGSANGKNGMQSLVASGLRPAMCLLPDSAAPGWNIEEKAKGVWRFELVANGRAAHGSRPWEGESASFKLIQALHEVKEYFSSHGPITDTLNIGVIHGGETYNVIPSRMSASMEIRVMSMESYNEKMAYILELCKKHDVEFHDRVLNPPLVVDLQHSLVQKYLSSVEAATGKRPQGVVSFAGSDAKYLIEAGIPYILSCPEGGGHHSENEWISRKSFLQFMPILHQYVDRVAKVS